MRIYIYSNSYSTGFGYSVVASKLAEEFVKAGHEVIYYNMQGVIRPHKDQNGIHHVGMSFDAFGADIFEYDLKSYQPDIVLTICDIWPSGMRFMHDVMKKFPDIRWIHHCTVNSSPLSPILESSFIGPDVLVAPSRFVENELRTKFSNVVYIPHGIDLNIFKPMDCSDLKEELGYKDKFVFLTVGRNKGFGMQKNWPALIFAYKIFCNSVQGAINKTILHMHTSPFDTEGMRIDYLRDKIGLGENIKFTYTRPKDDLSGLTFCNQNDKRAVIHVPNRNLQSEEMAKLYNIADCFVLPSEGESFCYPLLEAMACGIPVIATRNTAMAEHILESNAGLTVPVAMQHVTPLISEVGHVGYETLSGALYEMYTNEERRIECSKAGIEYAKRFSWENIIPLWLDLIEKVNEAKPLDYSRGELGI
jgi:glycosyltransferase involved in cell wall biosynthesis